MWVYNPAVHTPGWSSRGLGLGLGLGLRLGLGFLGI